MKFRFIICIYVVLDVDGKQENEISEGKRVLRNKMIKFKDSKETKNSTPTRSQVIFGRIASIEWKSELL